VELPARVPGGPFGTLPCRGGVAFSRPGGPDLCRFVRDVLRSEAFTFGDLESFMVRSMPTVQECERLATERRVVVNIQSVGFIFGHGSAEGALLGDAFRAVNPLADHITRLVGLQID
jgi:hypothetical protein